MTYFESNGYMIESSNPFIEQQHFSSYLRYNPIVEDMSINQAMLIPHPKYSFSSHLSRHTIQYSQDQQQRGQILDIEFPLDNRIINSLPDLFLKKLHCILTREILPFYIYWNTNQTSFTIRFETELKKIYLPELFQFFRISSFIKLLTNYGFKKKKLRQSILTYEFQHPQFLPSQPKLLESIILEYPNLDPYSEFVDNFMDKINCCKLNGYYLKLEVATLEEVNSVLKNELDQTRYRVEKLNLILYFLETGQFDKINLDEFIMLTTIDCYQLPEALANQPSLITSPAIQPSAVQITGNSLSTHTSMGFGLIDALTMSETAACDFITSANFKLPSGFLQSNFLSINDNFVNL